MLRYMVTSTMAHVAALGLAAVAEHAHAVSVPRVCPSVCPRGPWRSCSTRQGVEEASAGLVVQRSLPAQYISVASCRRGGICFAAHGPSRHRLRGWYQRVTRASGRCKRGRGYRSLWPMWPRPPACGARALPRRAAFGGLPTLNHHATHPSHTPRTTRRS